MAKEPAKTQTEDPEGMPDVLKKWRRLAVSYPKDTPDEQVVCGYAGIKMTVGDVRQLAEMIGG